MRPDFLGGKNERMREGQPVSVVIGVFFRARSTISARNGDGWTLMVWNEVRFGRRLDILRSLTYHHEAGLYSLLQV